MHHPDEMLLMEYSAGTLSEPMALCVRMHLEKCSHCRGQMDMLNSLGAIMMNHDNGKTGSDVAEDLFDNIMQQVEKTSPQTPDVTNAAVQEPVDPLYKLLGTDLKSLPWKKQLGDVSVCDLTGYFDSEERVTLQKLCAGGRAPAHSHHGQEATLVLTGAFADGNGVFEKGDFVLLDEHHDHQPVALHGEDCITLSVMTAPVRLTGRFTRMLNPFIR